MNMQKLAVITGAILINAVALALFDASTHAAATAAAIQPESRGIPTLPVITVRPSADQLRALRRAPDATAPARATSSACSGGVTPSCRVAVARVAAMEA